MRRYIMVFTLASLAPAVAAADDVPFRRTEQRSACATYVPTRQPLFGELHLHTQYSADAATLDTRNTPRDAYRFAKGAKVGLPPFFDTRVSAGPPSPGTREVVSSHPYCISPERCQFTATRSTQLSRPIDFAAVTDHAEWLGETNICFFEGTKSCSQDSECLEGQACTATSQGARRCVPLGYSSPECAAMRSDVAKLVGGAGSAVLGEYVSTENPSRYPFCATPVGHGGGGTCAFQANNVWQQILEDAEEAYDRSSQCSFTSFAAYEYTAMPGLGQCAGTNAPCWAAEDCGGAACLPNSGGANNLHRNIIFRNSNVVPRPLSYVDAPTTCGKGAACQHPGPLASPAQMLETLASECNPSHGCEFLSIPHNPNLSGGATFLIPETVAEAKTRATYEPLVEIMQIKGQSECRYSSAHPGAWGTLDEQCDFENMSFAKLTGAFVADPTPATILPGSYVREALKTGLAYARNHGGIDPFHVGFVGGTDNHNGTPSQVDEAEYAKAGAHGDVGFAVSGQALNETNGVGLETSGGALTVVWAEENSRDSIFEALARRETYATSGTRPVVRVFGGFNLPSDMCRRGDFVEQGYAHGVPMGGSLTGPSRVAPTFAVLATKDPGWDRQHPGTPLARIQIVKGWVDANGSHETVVDVAGDRGRRGRAGVDLDTCRPYGRGYEDLCASWTDPAFDPNAHAFYYARVLENPSCRWNQYYCASRGVDCRRPSQAGKDVVGYTQFEYDQCCSDAVPKTIQERAWTSPIWYAPGK